MQMCRVYSSLNLLSSVPLIMDGHKSFCFILEGCGVTKIEKPWHKISILNKTSNRYRECIYFLQILLFPEGTDLAAGSLQRSHQFASSHHLQRYYQVLHPKTTGFVFLVQRMRQSK
jgi:lysocardiolipin and lysophospholipid acyltransferase